MNVDYMRCCLVSEKKVEYEPVRQASDVMNIVKDIDDLISGSEEYVYLICLSCRGTITGIHQISHGTLNCSYMQPRAVIVRCLLNNASGLILIHNHPSGITDPSETDKQATQKIKEACELMELDLLDHIIVSGDDYFSFRANDLL